MLLILTTLILGIAGYNFMTFFHDKINSAEKISTGFLFSSAIFISLCFPLGLINQFFKPSNLILLSLGIYAISEIIKRYFSEKTNKEKFFQKNNKLTKISGILVGLILLSSFITNLYWPVRDWDAITLYDFRGRLFAAEGSISSTMYTMEPNYYLAYPFFTSLAHATIYTLSDYSPVIYYSTITIAFCLSFYHILRRKTNSTSAIIGTLLLISTFDIYSHSLISYTNLPYVIYIFLGLIYSYEAKNNLRIYFLSAIFVAISCAIRSDDPFWAIALVLSVYYSFTYKKISIFVLYLLTIITWKLPWSIYKDKILAEYVTSISTNYPSYTSIIPVIMEKWWSRGIEVAKFLFDKVLWYYNNYLAFLLLSMVLAFSSKLKNTYLSKLVVISFIAILFGGTYVLSFVYYKWDQVGGSAQRMMMILIPFIIYDSISTIYSYLSSKKVIL